MRSDQAGVDPATQAVVESKFLRLRDEWKAQRGPESSTQRMAMHPAYQKIIGLGPAVVPLLLPDMEENHTHWFYALRQITGANPIPQASAGNIPQMVEAWLRWAKGRRSLLS